MKAYPLAHRGGAFLWMSYGVALLTALFFLGVFSLFIFKGLGYFLLPGAGSYFPNLISRTLAVFSRALLLAASISLGLIFFFEEKPTSPWSTWSLTAIRESLRCPSLVWGIAILYFCRSWDAKNAILVILVFLMIPRLTYGWYQILRKSDGAAREVGLSLGLSSWQIFISLSLRSHWLRFFEYSLKVSVILAGAVSPFVYLTSLSFLTSGPKNFISLEAFQSLVKGQDQSPQVWISLSALAVFTFLFSLLDGDSSAEFEKGEARV